MAKTRTAQLPAAAEEALHAQVRSLEGQLAEGRKRLEDEVARAERLEASLRATHEGIWDWNILTGEATFTPRFHQLLGYEKDGPGKRIVELDAHLHPDDRGAAVAALEAHLQRQTPFDVEVRLKCHDGSYRWFRARGEADRDGTGRATRMAGSIADITAHVEMIHSLAEEKERFALAVRGTYDGIWDWDMRTQVVYYSPRWKAMVGYEDAELENQFATFENLLHPDDKERVYTTLQDYLDCKLGTYSVEFRLKHKDGFYRWILGRGRALRDEDKKPYRMTGSHTDITDQKQAEAELVAAKHAAEEACRGLGPFFQVALDMLCIAGMDGYFKRINPAFCSTLGYAETDLLEKPFLDFVHPEDHEKTIQGVADLGKGKDLVSFVNRYRHKDGTYLWIEWTAAPSGGMIYAAARNITSRIRAEKELHEARQAAEAANRAKSAFLANMSHEIRTPMNGIIGMTELLLDTELTAEQRSYQNLVRESAEALMTVLNDILDFSKIEAGKLDLDKYAFDLRDTIGDALQTLALRSAEKEVELAYRVRADVRDSLLGDACRLRQILLNLVGNALKFTQKGEIVVDVSLKSTKKKWVMLHFLVKDTGIGIAKDKQRKIFESFTQADSSTTRRYGGTGLGLTISKQLVELMHGEMWLESKLGHGSTFHFTAMFGLGPENPGQVRPVPDTLHAFPVLVVDDNDTNRNILEQMLLNWEMQPILAASGPEALQLLNAAKEDGKPVQLILLDAMMPGMDGLTVARQVHQIYGQDAPKIFILSSAGHPQDASRGGPVDIERFLTKPVKQSDLFDAITRSVGIATREDKKVIPATKASSPGPMKVLLVEDSRVNQLVATKLLSERGHSVIVASHGKEALEILGAGLNVFDVILMDVQMPEMNGYQATGVIRQQEVGTGNHVPIIAMTANAMKGDREQCLAAGMDDYISKPVRSADLYSIVEKYGGHEEAPRAPATSKGRPRAKAAVETLAPFDPEGFKTAIGDSGLMRELVSVYAEDTEKLLSDAHHALRAQDCEALYQAAHALKGLLGVYSGAPAFRAATVLAESARLGDLRQTGKLLPALVTEVSQLGEALEEFGMRL